MKKSTTLYSLIMLILLGQNVHVNAQYTKIVDFNVINGQNPSYSTLISDGTFLYGMTPFGGPNGAGLIFKIQTDNGVYTDLFDFNGTNGAYPYGSLFNDGTYLYAVTAGGGANNLGLIFKIKPDGSGYQDLLDFDGSNGSTPQGSLISDGSFLYGMARRASGASEVFKVKKDGSEFMILMQIEGSSAGGVTGSLISDGTYLYGMTTLGGNFGKGVLFKVKTDGTAPQILLNFSTTNGANPTGSLVSDGTYLYGMTTGGGASTKGLVFKIKADGTGYTDLLDFGGTNGSYPQGSLLIKGTSLYGMTQRGGNNDAGLLFKINMDGSGYSDLMEFDGANGQNPYGSLFDDGTYLYAMTCFGGTSDKGVLFKYKYQAALPVTLVSFTAVLENSYASLNWVTGVETGLSHFEIEKSSDAQNYTTLSSVVPRGSNSNYTYTTNQQEDISFYRLKMILKGGQYKFSDVKTLSKINTEGVSLFPNPATSTIHVMTPYAGQLTIYNTSGKLIMSQALKAGANSIDVHALSAGVYFGDVNGTKLNFIKK